MISRTRGHKKLHVDVKTLARDGVTVTGPSAHFCGLCCHVGWVDPNVSLFSQGRGTLKFDAIRVFVPDQCPWPAEVIGAAQGTFAPAHVCQTVRRRVNAAKAQGLGKHPTYCHRAKRSRNHQPTQSSYYSSRSTLGVKQTFCRFSK